MPNKIALAVPKLITNQATTSLIIRGEQLCYVSKIGLGVGARYVYGLTDTIDDGGGNYSSNHVPELKNSVIQIGLSYRFGTNI